MNDVQNHEYSLINIFVTLDVFSRKRSENQNYSIVIIIHIRQENDIKLYLVTLF